MDPKCETNDSTVNSNVENIENNNQKNVELNKDERYMKQHPQPWCGLHEAKNNSSTTVYNYSTNYSKEKSLMCRVAEIARFNNLRHVYDLLDESGPAHKKLFTVKLTLSDNEVYFGHGNSIKKAQQAAAQKAIDNTSLPHPPEKSKRRNSREDPNMLPSMLLHACRALQLPIPSFETLFLTNFMPPDQDVGYMPNFYPPFSPQPIPNHHRGYYLTNLRIGKEICTNAAGPTAAESRRLAALNALEVLSPTLKELKEAQVKNVVPEQASDEEYIPKYKQKSVISDVHEKAHKLLLNVVFEVIQEEGPPHNRIYKVRCAFLNDEEVVVAESVGSGKKKKEAQQKACTEILNKIKSIENDPVYVATTICRSMKKMKTVQREQKRKTIIKDKKMDPEYGHQINPVSRLIQVLQTKERVHPTFELISEQGNSPHKEFVIRVTCGNDSCEGKGPNKRLAKRAAAEAMLELIGYVKPLPQPGKSLLKKKSINNNNDKENDNSVAEEQDHDNDNVSVDSNDKADANETESESRRRRVTFNNQVKACPPPGDQNYPNPEIGPLKAEVIIEGKIRRIRRTKENRRSLTAEQKVEVAKLAKNSLERAKEPDYNAVSELEELVEKYKVSVKYTSFPKEAKLNGDFILVSLGFEDPVVCHGEGLSPNEAKQNAAISALKKLCGEEAAKN